MLNFVFEQPGRVIFGRGRLRELGEVTAQLGSRAMLVTGRRFARTSGYLEQLVNSLESAGLEVVVFAEVEPNPSLETVDRGARLAAERGVDVVVGFG
ncbi:MAG: alcohol dehydrogenase, partial [Thermoprotei archaeon]